MSTRQLTTLSDPLPPGTTEILGVEFSGTIEDAGSTQWQKGDEVFGLTYGGAYAQLVAVAGAMLTRKPAELTHVQAAAMCVAASGHARSRRQPRTMADRLPSAAVRPRSGRDRSDRAASSAACNPVRSCSSTPAHPASASRRSSSGRLRAPKCSSRPARTTRSSSANLSAPGASTIRRAIGPRQSRRRPTVRASTSSSIPLAPTISRRTSVRRRSLTWS